MPAESADLLLIEDSPSDAKLTMLAIAQVDAGVEVHVAQDGAAALEYIFERAAKALPLPRLVLTDLKLPRVSGLEVVARLKTRPDTKRIPVVVFSSSREDRDLSEAYRLGVNGYVVKPSRLDDFTRTVEAILRYWLSANLTP